MLPPWRKYEDVQYIQKLEEKALMSREGRIEDKDPPFPDEKFRVEGLDKEGREGPFRDTKPVFRCRELIQEEEKEDIYRKDLNRFLLRRLICVEI